MMVSSDLNILCGKPMIRAMKKTYESIIPKDPIVYQITDCGLVDTIDGPMIKVRLLSSTAPTVNVFQITDAAILCGKLCENRASNRHAPLFTIGRSVFFWNNKFWTCAVLEDGLQYYKNKCDLFYEINLDPQQVRELTGS